MSLLLLLSIYTSQFPDANLPALLVYHGGACKKHLVGTSAFGGPRITPERE